MTTERMLEIYSNLRSNPLFWEFVRGLVDRYGAVDRTCFVPGDPYSSAFNEGARSVVAWLTKLDLMANAPERGSEQQSEG
jgi:hypothetical protein